MICFSYAIVPNNLLNKIIKKKYVSRSDQSEICKKKLTYSFRKYFTIYFILASRRIPHIANSGHSGNLGTWCQNTPFPLTLYAYNF